MSEVVVGCNDFGVVMAEVSVLDRKDLVAGKGLAACKALAGLDKIPSAAVASPLSVPVPQSNSLDQSCRSQLFPCVRERLSFCACVR